MSNSKLAIIIVLAFVVLGSGWFVFRKKSDGMISKNESIIMEQEKKDAMEQPDSIKEEEKMAEGKTAMDYAGTENAMMTNKRYVEYASDVLEKTQSTRRVLFFYASWCPLCKPVNAELEEKVNQIPSDSTVIRVHYNDPETDQEEKNLAKKYGVTYQHTFVQIDQNGDVVARWNGGNLADLLKNIK